MGIRVTVQIKFGEGFFYSEEPYDDVVRKIADGVPLDVYESYFSEKNGQERIHRRICFFGDVDWVAVDL